MTHASSAHVQTHLRSCKSAPCTAVFDFVLLFGRNVMISCLFWKKSADQHGETNETRNQQPFEARSAKPGLSFVG